jgi:hypothetical protein
MATINRRGTSPVSVIFLVLIVAWIIFSTLWDDRPRSKEQALLKMKDSYSKQEALELAVQMRREALIYYLIYGFLVGVTVASTIQH